MWHKGHKRWEVDNITGERMEETDDGVLVPVHDQEAIDGIEDAVVLKDGELGTHEPPRVEVEEADVAAELAMGRVQAMALRQHHPATRVEARVVDAVAARGNGARPPVGANRAEVDVVQQVAGQHTPGNQAKQLLIH